MVDATQDLLYTPIFDTIPNDWPNAKFFIVEQLTAHAEAINAKEIGWYYDVETDTGKKFIPVTNEVTSNQWRTVFRKVIDCGTLPNATTTNTAHGITFDSNFCLIDLSGGATDPSTAAIPLPYTSTTAANSVQVSMDATNIIITTAIDYSAYTKCFVVVEYLQEG